MPTTPGITLTATLQDVSGAADNGSALIVTLCGYGQTLPRIVGTSLLAKIGPTRTLAPAGTVSIPLYGNDVISPAGTFYSVSVVDDKNNVVQTGIYYFSGVGTFDLSSAPQITAPALLAAIPQLIVEKPTGTIPGTAYTLSQQPYGNVLMGLYLAHAASPAGTGGGFLRPVTAPVDYTLVGTTITLAVSTIAGDVLTAVYCKLPAGATAGGSGPAGPTGPQGPPGGGANYLEHIIAGAINGINRAYVLPSTPSVSPMVFVNGVRLSASRGDYTIAGVNLTINTPQPLQGGVFPDTLDCLY